VMTSDLDNLITSIDVGTLYLDADLCVRRFTPGLERVVKLMDQDLGRHITDFAHHLTHDFVSDIEEVVASGCPVSREVRDQQGAWLLMRARPYKTFHHAQAGVLLTFIDITRLKHAEETARVMSESLRDANEALSSQAEQLEDMFSIVAHDLKRPVLGLDGLMAMAADALEEDAVDLARTHLGRAQQSLDTLKRLLADLSSVSQQARAELQVESVELGVWFDALLAPFAELAARRGITLNRACDGGQVAFARAAGEAAIVNLVENALQYGMGAEQPRLDVSCRYNTSTLTLVVSDNGKGIARADHARAFELFRRLSPDDAEGSGVGLVSVRRLVQRAGGTLDLESDTWQGARFEVTLPVEAVDKGLLRFLLVEDDALDAKATRIALPHHEVDHVFTLTDAEDALTASRYDCVLLDLSLPDGHGLALLGTMKRLGRRLPVALLTGLEDTLEPDLLKNQREIVATFSKSRLRQKDFREMLLHALETAEPG
jgi:two-component system CheB/CheR fusion protein